MREWLTEILRGHGADFAEIRLEEIERLNLSVSDGKVTSCSRGRSRGGIVRCLVRGAWGVASCDDSEQLEDCIRRASEAAKAASALIHDDERVILAPVEPVQDEVLADFAEAPRLVSLDTKLDNLREADETVRAADPGISRSVTSYADRMRKMWLVNSEGTAIYQERPLIDFRLIGYVKRDGLQLRAYEALSLPRGFEVCRGRSDMVDTVTARTRALRDAIAPPSAELPVVMNYEMAGLFAHEAFGHLCEADNVHRDSDLRRVMTLGKRFGSDVINIGDDSGLPGLRATHPYDDEGVPTRKNYLLREGVLVGRMHNRETAGALDEELTGNGRAISYRHTPIVRMTNTFIDPGETSFEDMTADIKLGLYACGHMGGSTTKEQFIFNGSYGHMIRDGKLAEMVYTPTLTGNVFQTLHDIDAVGNVQQWHEMGFCGKGGQRGHPTSKGCPHIRVRKLVVGGR
jgi:TldD protein